MLNLLGQIIFGLIVGIIAKLLMPGRDPGGFILTAIIGIVGALIGTLIGRALWGGADYSAGWITSILGALILLTGYRFLIGRRGHAGGHPGGHPV
ncbi:MAG: GlsB/YeaQ/YmgE family stress response membrane protein [Blastocatellales bacterium]